MNAKSLISIKHKLYKWLHQIYCRICLSISDMSYDQAWQQGSEEPKVMGAAAAAEASAPGAGLYHKQV